MMTLIILNDPPYGTERSYNGLRLAMAVAKHSETDVRVFLMGDAVSCARAGQKTPNGYYNLERMIEWLVSRKVPLRTCGSCMDARGLTGESMIAGVARGSMDELADWHRLADKVSVF
jgi:uncharacterized protein involved in oxidation of intracellular sulfur